MRGTKSLLAILVMAGLLVGCQSKQNEPIRSTSSSGGTSTAPSGERADQSNMALVRFINAVPDMKTVNAYMDSNMAFTDVSFKTVTPYREVPDGRHTFHLGDNASMQAGRDRADTRIGDNERMGVNESESLSSGTYYTVVLRPDDDIDSDNDSRTMNNGRATKIQVIKDDFGSPSDDKAHIRVIDAAARVGKVDIYMRPKNDELFSNIDIDSSPSYKQVDPGSVTLEVRGDGKNNALFTLPNTMVEAGHHYTVVLTGKGTNGRNLDAVIVEDQYAQRRDTNQGGADDRSYDNRDNDNR
ncbi:DUF4397 domain-containing protein [bacterium]|nr:MAG: DUF4397 domain-containing protein [bacterium]